MSAAPADTPLPDFRTLPLAERLRVFTDAGLLTRLPTRWQRFQGQLEMLLYVLLPDARDGLYYGGTPLGNMFLRQPLTLAHVGLDHLRLGDGLGATAEGLFGHLMFVYHGEFPAYDLQLIQTHPDGLGRLRRFIEVVENAATPSLGRLRRAAELVIPDAASYRRRFLDPGGYIDRAEALDYPPAGEIAPGYRAEFQTLLGFLDYCARTHPERPGDTSPWQLPIHLFRLFTSWFRDPNAWRPAN